SSTILSFAAFLDFKAEIDFLTINSCSSDQVMTDAVYLQESWPRLEGTEKRKMVECITNKIVIFKEAITIDLCCLPSSEELSKRNWSLGDSFPFCHIRMKWVSISSGSADFS